MDLIPVVDTKDLNAKSSESFLQAVLSNPEFIARLFEADNEKREAQFTVARRYMGNGFPSYWIGRLRTSDYDEGNWAPAGENLWNGFYDPINVRFHKDKYASIPSEDDLLCLNSHRKDLLRSTGMRTKPIMMIGSKQNGHLDLLIVQEATAKPITEQGFDSFMDKYDTTQLKHLRGDIANHDVARNINNTKKYKALLVQATEQGIRESDIDLAESTFSQDYEITAKDLQNTLISIDQAVREFDMILRLHQGPKLYGSREAHQKICQEVAEQRRKQLEYQHQKNLNMSQPLKAQNA